ncbi:DUF4942 domain-containing protein [Xanthomonas axonopodis]
MNDILPGVDFSSYLEKRNVVVEKIESAFQQIHDAVWHAKEGMLYGLRLHDNEIFMGRQKNELIEVIDRTAWDYLMKQSGLWSFLDAASRNTWLSSLSRDEVLPFTQSNITATFSQYYDSRSKMRDQGLSDLFLGLNKNYKTNQCHLFDRKCIVKLADWYGNFDYGSVSKIDDLARVFCELDGKPEFDHRHATHEMLIKGCWDEAQWNEFFSLKLFKNKNAHITFKRLDLLDKLNQELARLFPNALPSHAKTR